MKYEVDHEKYEYARKNFRKLLDRGKMVWLPYREEHDLNVQVSRIYMKDQSNYIAILRIKPRGFQAPKKVASDSKIIFHLLAGSALFGYNKKIRFMSAGQYVSIPRKTVYTIRNPDMNNVTYFLLQYADIKKQLKAPPERLAIEAAPAPPEVPLAQPEAPSDPPEVPSAQPGAPSSRLEAPTAQPKAPQSRGPTEPKCDRVLRSATKAALSRTPKQEVRQRSTRLTRSAVAKRVSYSSGSN